MIPKSRGVGWVKLIREFEVDFVKVHDRCLLGLK